MDDVENMPVREVVLSVLQKENRPLSPKEMAERTDANYNSLRSAASRMEKEGKLEKISTGIYQLPTQQSDASDRPGTRPRNAAQNRESAPVQTEADEIMSYELVPHGPGASANGTADDGQRNTISINRMQLSSYVNGPVPGPERAFWTRVVGESMAPWLPNGALILVEECNRVTTGDRYVFYMGDTETHVVKRAEWLSERKLRLASDNTSHATRTYHHQGGNLFKDEDGDNMHIAVRGRVV